VQWLRRRLQPPLLPGHSPLFLTSQLVWQKQAAADRNQHCWGDEQNAGSGSNPHFFRCPRGFAASFPPARADGEALQAPERRVVTRPRPGAGAPPRRRVPGGGGVWGRPAAVLHAA
jgi:hypothetical protein